MNYQDLELATGDTLIVTLPKGVDTLDIQAELATLGKKLQEKGTLLVVMTDDFSAVLKKRSDKTDLILRMGFAIAKDNPFEMCDAGKRALKYLRGIVGYAHGVDEDWGSSRIVYLTLTVSPWQLATILDNVEIRQSVIAWDVG